MKGPANTPVLDISSDASEGGFDFSQVGVILREKLWLIVLFTLVGLFAGFAYIKGTPSTYLATTTIDVSSQQLKLVSFADVQSSGQQPAEMADSIVAGFKSRSFLARVVEANKLVGDPLFLPPSADGTPQTVDTAVAALVLMEEVEVRRGTPFIDVSVQHPNPRMAQKLADAIADEFIRQNIKQKAGASEMAVEFLLGEATKLRDQLQRSEEALQTYLENSDVSVKDAFDTAVAKQKLLNSQLGEARAQRIRLEGDHEAVLTLADNPPALLNLASVSESPGIVEIKEKISALEGAVSALSLRYTEKHPKMIQVQLQLADAKRALMDSLSRVPAMLKSNYEAVLATETKLEAELKHQNEMLVELNKKAITYNVLAREVETNKALHESIVRRLKEMEVAKGIELNNVRIFEPANLPTLPMQPKKSKTLAIAIALGFATGVGLSFGLNALDSSLRTVDQAEQVTRLGVLGAIPREVSSDLSDRALSLHRNPASPVAEAFRSLRASLNLSIRSTGRPVVLFTSAEPGEGKTFCAVNYAVAVAQQGLRTLLIDADLRLPMIETVVLRENGSRGLSDYLDGTAGPAATIHPTEVENLLVMPAGFAAPNPAELLASPVFGELIEALRKDFHRIVIDTAPVMAVSDAMLLLEHVDSVCLVSRAGKTPRKMILRTCQLLRKAGAKQIGLILNRIAPSRVVSRYGMKYGKIGTSPRSVKPGAEMAGTTHPA